MHNNKPKRMPRALEKAIKNNDVELAKKILADEKYQHREWINCVNGSGRSPLLLAAKYNCHDIVKHLLSSFDQIDVDAQSYNYRDYRYKGIWSYNLPEEIQLLIIKRLGINISPYTGRKAFREAVRGFASSALNSNSVSIMRALIEKEGVDLNVGLKSFYTPLTEAINDGKIEIVRFLLSHKEIDVNYQDLRGHVPIFYALVNKNQQILRLLLEHPKIGVNLQKCGEPLIPWLKNKNPRLFRYVLDLPGTVIEIDYDKIRSIKINFSQVISILNANADFDMNNHLWDGETFLTKAVKEQRDDQLKILLAYGPRVDIHRQNLLGETALTLAYKMGRTEIISAIKDHPGFDVTAVYQHGQNLLMLAAQMGCFNLVRDLLESYQLPVNAVDEDGNNAIMLLAMHHKDKNNANLFTLLFAHGADPLQKNNKGINAVMAAANNELHGIALELQNAASQRQQQLQVTDAAPSAPPLDEHEVEVLEKAYNKKPEAAHSRLFTALEKHIDPISIASTPHPT